MSMTTMIMNAARNMKLEYKLLSIFQSLQRLSLASAPAKHKFFGIFKFLNYSRLRFYHDGKQCGTPRRPTSDGVLYGKIRSSLLFALSKANVYANYQ